MNTRFAEVYMHFYIKGMQWALKTQGYDKSNVLLTWTPDQQVLVLPKQVNFNLVNQQFSSKRGTT